jgi:hypothetical protein
MFKKDWDKERAKEAVEHLMFYTKKITKDI